jgi:hypothetical protein
VCRIEHRDDFLEVIIGGRIYDGFLTTNYLVPGRVECQCVGLALGQNLGTVSGSDVVRQVAQIRELS